jgi:hypothetical protein
MPEILLHKGDIELGRADLDGAYLQFDIVPDRNVLVAESGQTYVLNEAVGRIERHGFSVHPVTIEITGRKIRYLRFGGATIRVRVVFEGVEGTGEPLLATLFFSGNENRLQWLQNVWNLDYRVRPRIEDVEEYGE